MSKSLAWFKSSYSGGEGECLELAATPTAIHIRDSKHGTGTGTGTGTGPTLHLSPAAWTAFLPHATALVTHR
ncbi:DUF397 domain-containing protein [Streptomyces sp. G5(2025)]|uniref:DUF397 domain-containing protein n=1 Tax=Streptomyces sp. G5(2025) TaxID=3406628 RepID=UPI003C1C95DB